MLIPKKKIVGHALYVKDVSCKLFKNCINFDKKVLNTICVDGEEGFITDFKFSNKSVLVVPLCSNNTGITSP